jgi:hypothetical protein
LDAIFKEMKEIDDLTKAQRALKIFAESPK